MTSSKPLSTEEKLEWRVTGVFNALIGNRSPLEAGIVIVYCSKCEVPIRDGEEISYTATSYFKQLASRVAFSVSTPHEADKETFKHTHCPSET